MEPGTHDVKPSLVEPLLKVTPLSKYLAMILFIIMPFLGGWIGYVYIPEKVVGIGIQEKTHQKTNGVIFEEDSKVYNWGDYNNKYLVDKMGAYCLVEINNKLQKNPIPDLDPDTFKVLRDSYVKDNNRVYKVLCPKSNEVSVSRYEVSDITTFDTVPELKYTGPNIFTDKDYVYLSLPQEFSIQKIDVDRSTFKPLGFGEERSVDLLEGLKDLTKDYYFKDATAVYVIEEYGQFKKLDIPPENFDIETYENLISR
jgi:DKNYY family